MTTLTAIPISTFQMIVKRNVSDIRRRSIHARILFVLVSLLRSTAPPHRYVLPVKLRIVRKLRQQGEDDEADAEVLVSIGRDAVAGTNSHGRKHAFRQVVEPRQEEERRKEHKCRRHQRGHLRAAPKIAVQLRPGDGAIGGKRARNERANDVPSSEGHELAVGADAVSEASSVLLGCDDTV